MSAELSCNKAQRQHRGIIKRTKCGVTTNDLTSWGNQCQRYWSASSFKDEEAMSLMFHKMSSKPSLTCLIWTIMWRRVNTDGVRVKQKHGGTSCICFYGACSSVGGTLVNQGNFHNTMLWKWDTGLCSHRLSSGFLYFRNIWKHNKHSEQRIIVSCTSV